MTLVVDLDSWEYQHLVNLCIYKPDNSLQSSSNTTTYQTIFITMNSLTNNQQQVMVLVPLDTYLKTDLGSKWIYQQLQLSPNRPPIDSPGPIKKK